MAGDKRACQVGVVLLLVTHRGSGSVEQLTLTADVHHFLIISFHIQKEILRPAQDSEAPDTFRFTERQDSGDRAADYRHEHRPRVHM